MPSSLSRSSPLWALQAARQPIWREIAGAALPLCYTTAATEREAAERLALCDLSALPKAGLKGPGAATWLRRQAVPVPEPLYRAQSLPAGGIILKVSADEYFLQAGPTGGGLPPAPLVEDDTPGCFPVTREDAAMVLCGARCGDVLRQVCGYDFSDAPRDQGVFTRLAGVDAAVFPSSRFPYPLLRIWCDCSYAISLWESLTQICAEFDGPTIGAQALFAELQ